MSALFVQNLTQVKQHIPNVLTSLNLFLGCLSVVAALEGNLQLASIYIFSAAILDFFDGFVARALHATSEMGKQLDSLADVVSFGLAPGLIFYMMAGKCFAPNGGVCINMYLPFLIVIFSALRLAKFNIDTRQSDSFIGLPTPANALFIASIPFILQYNPGIAPILEHEYFLKYFPLLSAYLLTAELPLLALKFKSFAWKGNEYRYVLIILSLAGIALFQFAGIALSMILYILISILYNLQTKKAV